VQGHLPPAFGWYPGSSGTAGNGQGNPFFHLLPYLEQGALYRSSALPGSGPIFSAGFGLYFRPIKTYLCPSDPGVTPAGMAVIGPPPQTTGWAAGCYAANAQVFGLVANPLTGALSSYQGCATIPTSFSDGTSQTILFTEKYATCGNGGSVWDEYSPGSTFYPWMPLLEDSGRGAGAVGAGSKFQLRPSPTTCNPILSQTAHSGGILVCLADGSLKTVTVAVSGTTWWAACTPAASDLLAADWD
jgi:hypothetical protein